MLQNKIFGLSHERDQLILVVWDSQNTNPLTVSITSEKRNIPAESLEFQQFRYDFLIPFKINKKKKKKLKFTPSIDAT